MISFLEYDTLHPNPLISLPYPRLNPLENNTHRHTPLEYIYGNTSRGFAAHNVIRLIIFHACSTVPDPDLEIRRGRSSRLLEKGGGGAVSKKIFSALQASVWSKKKGEGEGAVPWIRHCSSPEQERLSLSLFKYNQLNLLIGPHSPGRSYTHLTYDTPFKAFTACLKQILFGHETTN